MGADPLVIIADSYDGNGGSIDASGRIKNPNDAVPGSNGVDGAPARFKTVAHRTWPVSAGGNGTSGKNGESGSSGVDVTLLCCSGVHVNINTVGTPGAPGGDAGRGGDGGDGWYGAENRWQLVAHQATVATRK